MKLCYLSASTIPSETANSIHVMKMCAALAAGGHSVTLFAKESALREEPFYFYGVPLSFRLCLRPQTSLARALLGWRVWKLYLRWQVRALAPDLLYGRNPKALATVCSLGMPFVLEAHMLPSQADLQQWLFRQPNFARLVVISKALKEDYLATFPSLSEQRILVAPDAASPPPPPGLLPKRETGERLQVGYVGHLYAGKGVEIIARLPKRCPWADFHIVGGKAKDLAYWKSILGQKANLTLHGFVPHREAGVFIAGFDVVLAPYQSCVQGHGGNTPIGRWMSPLKIFEYMPYGKPIIASDLPVLQEVLEDGRNALLVPPAEIDSWAKAITRLRDDAALRARLGRAVLQDFETHYSWESRARAVLERIELRNGSAKRPMAGMAAQ